MTGCRTCPGRLGAGPSGKAAGLAVCLFFFAGTTGWAQSTLGAPRTAPQEESPPSARLEAPLTSDPPKVPSPGNTLTLTAAPTRTNSEPTALSFSGPPIPVKRNTPNLMVAAQEIPGRGAGMLAPPVDEGRPVFPPLIRLDVPDKQVLFRLESEEELRARMRQEAMQRERGKQLYFPDTRIVMSPDKKPPPRNWQPLAELVEPADVGFKRLWFYQINFDRYGWELGVFQPAVSTGLFYFDILTLPLQFVMEPYRRFDYNSGWCLPGDPAPLALYPFRPK